MKGTSTKPLIIAHRGASGYRPEHTLEAYELGLRLGADFIEPDVVITRDGVLVARHENELSATTDVADHPEFARRRTSKEIHGAPVSGWFCEDFTLAELKMLRARARSGPRSTDYDGLFTVPTVQEVLALANEWSARLGRPVGVCPELKFPAHFASLGLPLEPPLVALLEASGLSEASTPILIQSFEAEPLKRLSARGFAVVQLMDEPGLLPEDPTLRREGRTWRDLTTRATLERFARYASTIGCSKRLLVPAGRDGRLLPPTSLVRDAHQAGLKVHVWTFRNEAEALAPDYDGDPVREVKQFLELGVDGLITDFPDTAAAALQRLARPQGAPCT